jgi:hypothetical protein
MGEKRHEYSRHTWHEMPKMWRRAFQTTGLLQMAKAGLGNDIKMR